MARSDNSTEAPVQGRTGSHELSGFSPVISILGNAIPARHRCRECRLRIVEDKGTADRAGQMSRCALSSYVGGVQESLGRHAADEGTLAADSGGFNYGDGTSRYLRPDPFACRAGPEDDDVEVPHA
jgi:hypothetical protein